MCKEKLNDIDLSKTIEDMKKSALEVLIKEMTSSEEFMDTQKGIISVWLKEAFEKGCEIGQLQSVANDPEVMEGVKGFIGRMNDIVEPSANEDIELIKELYRAQRLVSFSQNNIISELNMQIDMLFGKMIPPNEKNALTCLGFKR